jgi:8-oxoguanine deaminase
MSTLLLRNADILVTMDTARREISGGGIFVRDNLVAQVGPSNELPATADVVVEAAGLVVLPGLVNTHHHLYQTLTRAVPEAQNVELFEWLRVLYEIWGELTDEAAYASARVGLAELLLSGCTTSSDHLYLYPRDTTLDGTIRAARELGIRFQPCRGAMSLGRSQGGLPPDRLVEDEERILADMERLIRRYHDPRPAAMTRIALAPCSPFSVTEQLMRESGDLARRHNVMLHTHLAETADEVAFCRQRFGCRPLAYAERLGWLGSDVWFAHCVLMNSEEIALMAATGTGVAHCPSSNMRLGSGIAPIREMLVAGVKVGLAVDGSASNDSSHLLAEARQAMLLQRVKGGATALSARQALEMATLGGGGVLGRDDIGSLEPGKAADFVGFRLGSLPLAGAQDDPVAALVFCEPRAVDVAVINGRTVVRGGVISGFCQDEAVSEHNRLAAEMLRLSRQRQWLGRIR